MKLKKSETFLKLIIVGVAICGIVLCAFVIPSIGKHIVLYYKELSHWYLPWLIFVTLTSLPCFTALVPLWQIATRIGADNSFCVENAKALKLFSTLAYADSAFFFLGNIVLLFAGFNHPTIVMLSLLAVFAGIAIAIISSCLSHLVLKAASIKDENDLTI